jgi:hypothetical protein
MCVIVFCCIRNCATSGNLFYKTYAWNSWQAHVARSKPEPDQPMCNVLLPLQLCYLWKPLLQDICLEWLAGPCFMGCGTHVQVLAHLLPCGRTVVEHRKGISGHKLWVSFLFLHFAPFHCCWGLTNALLQVVCL